jgi:hypothetical protein
MFAEFDVWTVATGVAVAVATTAVVGMVAAVASLRDIRRYMLPHFTPPTDPDKPDNTLPSRTARQETRLREHLADEEEKTDRIEQRLDVGDGRMAKIEDSIEDVKVMVGDLRVDVARALERLAAGNPEVRR